MSRHPELNAAERKAIEEYRAAGYEVVPSPTREMLPSEVQSYVPDFVATRGGQHIAVAVKTREALRDDSQVRWAAEQFRKVPGWRFDLVVIGDEAGPPPEPKLLPKEVCLARLRSADRLANESHDPAGAVLLLWTAIEAALRGEIGESEDRRSLTGPRLIKEAFSLGILTKREWDVLDRLSQVRNQVAHGEQPGRSIKRTYESARAIAGRLVEEVSQN
jgi:hypothetical protein